MIREFFLETSEKYNDVFNTLLSEVPHMSRAEMRDMKTYLDDVWLNFHGVERQLDLHERVIRTLYDCLLENLRSERKEVEND